MPPVCLRGDRIDVDDLVAEISRTRLDEQARQRGKVPIRERREYHRLLAEDDAGAAHPDELVRFVVAHVADHAEEPADHLLDAEAPVDDKLVHVERGPTPKGLPSNQGLCGATVRGQHDIPLRGILDGEPCEVWAQPLQEDCIGRADADVDGVHRVVIGRDPT